MTVKEYLKQAFTIDKILRARRAQIEDCRDKRFFIGSILKDVNVQTGQNNDKLGDLSAEYLDLINMYAEDEKRLLRLKAEIKGLIDKLDNPIHRLIMGERYISLKKWEDIAVDNHYSWRAIHNFHSSALKCIEVHYLDMI